MSVAPRPIRVPDLREWKKRGQRLTMLTAYDATMARLFDQAGVDLLLVGDSLGMVIMGEDDTLRVTLDAMVHHTRAVRRGVQRALVVADMPFLSYQVSTEEAVRNAGRLVQEGGAHGVKLEGGSAVLPVVERLAGIGIPVMGHLGLTPQSIHQLGGFRQQARTEEGARSLLSQARALQDAGAFAIVLESVPAAVAREASEVLEIPTIGIGAGPHCDGQVLVSYDLLGLTGAGAPPFARRYADLAATVVEAVQQYVADVRQGHFPRDD
jgi:3-methyl-2-oxobutanoate hydroxymethyltransferase